jgi:signal transduction histidine kinase
MAVSKANGLKMSVMTPVPRRPFRRDSSSVPQALMTENARMSERLSISRDLHDILGHSLTTLTIHLDVAGRLASGQAAEHVQCAREVAGALLAEVRTIVNRVRVDPVDLRATLLALTEGAVGLEVELSLPEDLWDLDPARADAIVRCVQEAITNTLRHAQAKRTRGVGRRDQNRSCWRGLSLRPARGGVKRIEPACPVA